MRHGPVPPLSIWLNAGRYEWLLNCNRPMYGLLAEKGYDIVYREYNGGHNYPSWRDELDRGLMFQFGALSGSPWNGLPKLSYVFSFTLTDIVL